MPEQVFLVKDIFFITKTLVFEFYRNCTADIYGCCVGVGNIKTLDCHEFLSFTFTFLKWQHLRNRDELLPIIDNSQSSQSL